MSILRSRVPPPRSLARPDGRLAVAAVAANGFSRRLRGRMPRVGWAQLLGASSRLSGAGSCGNEARWRALSLFMNIEDAALSTPPDLMCWCCRFSGTKPPACACSPAHVLACGGRLLCLRRWAFSRLWVPSVITASRPGRSGVGDIHSLACLRWVQLLVQYSVVRLEDHVPARLRARRPTRCSVLFQKPVRAGLLRVQVRVPHCGCVDRNQLGSVGACNGLSDPQATSVQVTAASQVNLLVDREVQEGVVNAVELPAGARQRARASRRPWLLRGSRGFDHGEHLESERGRGADPVEQGQRHRCGRLVPECARQATDFIVGCRQNGAGFSPDIARSSRSRSRVAFVVPGNGVMQSAGRPRTDGAITAPAQEMNCRLTDGRVVGVVPPESGEGA